MGDPAGRPRGMETSSSLGERKVGTFGEGVAPKDTATLDELIKPFPEIRTTPELSAGACEGNTR